MKAFGHTRQTRSAGARPGRLLHRNRQRRSRLGRLLRSPGRTQARHAEQRIPHRDHAPMSFVKRETFGYGLNGKEFIVAEGAPYTTVSDSFGGTTAAIRAAPTRAPRRTRAAAHSTWRWTPAGRPPPAPRRARSQPLDYAVGSRQRPDRHLRSPAQRGRDAGPGCDSRERQLWYRGQGRERQLDERGK